ncbi:MAG TPA: VOC family protein [Flavobacterium sp.]|jgi:PhnB protein
MAAINPYITFNGNCEEAFLFYKSVFGGDFPYIGRFGDMPPTEGKSVSAEEASKIMHVMLPISSETVLMGSDSSDSYGHATVVGNNISVSVNTDSKEEAFKIFDGLSAGGKVTMPMEKTFWGAWFGMFTDKFDINWMVNFDEDPQK